MKKNVSYAQPLLEVIHEDRNKAQDDSELREMFKQMNNQMIEQKIVVAKINKLCLGALTSIEHLAKKMKEGRYSGMLFLIFVIFVVDLLFSIH